MDMQEFSRMNRERSERPDGFNHDLDSWSLSEWMTATLGELGEAANVLKKINRIEIDRPGVGDPPLNVLTQMFADEIADTFIYLDLMAQAAGFDLSSIALRKFRKTSEKIGYKP